MVTTYTGNDGFSSSNVGSSQTTPTSARVQSRSFYSYITSVLPATIINCKFKFGVLTDSEIQKTHHLTIRSKHDAVGVAINNPSRELNFKSFDTGSVLQDEIDPIANTTFTTQCVGGTINTSGNTDFRLASTGEGESVPVSVGSTVATQENSVDSRRPKLLYYALKSNIPTTSNTISTSNIPSTQTTPNQILSEMLPTNWDAGIRASTPFDEEPPIGEVGGN